tara:strand:+ start:211 stop:654 length:444 start_codon:yes stop_codon:yes gene_type:complete
MLKGIGTKIETFIVMNILLCIMAVNRSFDGLSRSFSDIHNGVIGTIKRYGVLVGVLAYQRNSQHYRNLSDGVAIDRLSEVILAVEAAGNFIPAKSGGHAVENRFRFPDTPRFRCDHELADHILGAFIRHIELADRIDDIYHPPASDN